MVTAPAETKFDLRHERRQARAPLARQVADDSELPPDVADIIAAYCYEPTRAVRVKELVPPGSHAIHAPNGIAIDAASGKCFVTDEGCDGVLVFRLADGSFVGSWGERGTGDGMFRDPAGICIGQDRRIYVADYGNTRIQVFTIEGKFVHKWSIAQDPAEEVVSCPVAVGWGPDGMVHVKVCVHTEQDLIQVFTPDGTFVSMDIRDMEIAATEPAYDHGDMCFADDGTRYVVDTASHVVRSSVQQGRFLRPRSRWGAYGDHVGEFMWPNGIAYSAALNVVCVSEGRRGRIQVFRHTAKKSILFAFDVWPVPVLPWPPAAAHPGIEAYRRPLGLAFDDDGLLYVAENAKGRVAVYALV